MSEAIAAVIQEPVATTLEDQGAVWEMGDASRGQYSVTIGYLRAFITMLVIANHAVMAYYPFAPAPQADFAAMPRLWRPFPIVDTHKFVGYGLFVGFNEIFFMSSMFLISGLFVSGSIRRKGTGYFLRDRVMRLGIPFIAAAAIVGPLTYYPSYILTGANPSFGAYWKVWTSLGEWPAGPVWFIWLLIVFDVIVAALFAFVPQWTRPVERLSELAFRKPAAFLGLFFLITAITYIPLDLAFGPYNWFSWGPFYLQGARPLHYFAYFLLGVGCGAYGKDHGLLSPAGKLVQHWPRWAIGAVFAFAGAISTSVLAMTMHGRKPLWTTLDGFTFVLSCAVSGLAVLAIFLRYANKRVRVFDSLKENAYGMYLLHYMFVTWVQYAILKLQLPGVVKGTIAFAASLALTWAAAASIRRIPGVARIL